MKTAFALIVFLFAGCGSTIKLGYHGKGGDIDVGFTFPEAKKLPPKKGLEK